MKCIACKKPAQVNILYKFCKDCFITHYQRRVERIVRKFNLIEEEDRILVAVSGGKDSLSCADLLIRLSKLVKFELGVIHLDVGVSACTNIRTEAVVREFCERRGVPFYFLSFREVLGFSYDLEEVFKRTRRPLCSSCGAIKRYALNKFARQNNFNKIATGHCADDIVRFFFKNWLSGHFDWISKFRPKTESNHPKVVTRIRPLFECLEVENLTYAKFREIPVAGGSKCSYFLRKDKWDQILRYIEEKKPGFKLGLVRGLEKVEISSPYREPPLRECKVCGEPTSKEVCSVCRIKESLKVGS